MDSNELFWATGINNDGLRANALEAQQIFTNLSNRVAASLDLITQKYGKVIAASQVKFGNPVEDGMIANIQSQIAALGKTIDVEIQKLGNFSAKYDQSISKIQTSANKIQTPGGSPLAPMVAGIQADVAKSTEELSFLERRFKYAFGSMLAYGSVRILKSFATELIDVKTQFQFLQTSINSFAGSAEKGAKIMAELTRFAVESPLQVNDITEAAKQLMAFGVGADNVVTQIKMLSDVAAGAGKPIKDIAYIYGKSLTEGKVYTRTLMQFGNLGIPIYKALADVMDTTPDKIKKMTQMGAVGFDDIKRAIESLTSAGGQYYNFSGKMMDTTAGLLSNVKDKWILAMKDMGESSDGFINGSVRMVDDAIAHWRELGEAIVVAATAVGSYQVAKTVVGWSNAASTASSNLVETNTLFGLMSAESQEGIIKQGLVVGSIEYQTAIRAEIALQMQKATAAVASAEAEVASATEAYVAQDTLLTSGKLRVAQANLVTAAEAKQALTTDIATASTAAATAGTDLFALAGVKLRAVWATLNVTMMENPIAATVVAMVTLVAIMWALNDSTTAAEKAQKNLKVALDAIDAQATKKAKMFSDNLDIIKNKQLDGTAAQIKAYQVLHDIFGSIIGDKTLDQLKTMNSVDLQNQMNKANEYAGVLQRKKNLDLAQQAFLQQKTAVSNLGAMPSNANPSEISYYKSENDKLSALRGTYLGELKDYNDYVKNYNAARAASYKKEEDDSYDHWKEMKDAADLYLKGAGTKAAEQYYAGTMNPESAKKYKEQLDNIVLANKKMAEIPDSSQSNKADKAAISAQELRNREAADAVKRLEAIRANNTELANLKSKAETDATQATIDAMDAGYAKEKAQQENNFEKKLSSLDSEKAKILKKEQENIGDIYLNMNPNKSKNSTPPPTVSNLGDGKDGVNAGYDSLLKQATAGGMTQTVALINESLSTAKDALATYNKEVDSTQKDNDAKLGILLEKQLLEYGDYTAKKTEIEKKYNATLLALADDREKASKKGNTGMVSQIDSAILQANVNKSKDLMSLSFDQLKSTPEYAMAFEDLNNVSTETLEKLMGEMEKLKRTAAGTMSVTDFKEYSKEMQKVTDDFIKRNPFKVLREEAEKLKTAQEEVNNAKLDVLFAKSGLGKDSTGKIGNISEGEQALATSKAVDKLSNSENNLKTIQNNGLKATKETIDAFGELSKQMSTLGSSIGGMAGGIISSIGEIGSFVTTAITAWQTASNTATGALLAVEQASVILGVISAAITVATKIVSLFTDASSERAAYWVAETAAVLAFKKAYLDTYASITDNSFANVFGDDVFGKATAQTALMKKASDDYISAYNSFIKSIPAPNAGENNMKDVWADYLKLNTAEAASIANFDIIKAKAELAGNALSAASKTALQALVDDYDSYQSYLSEIDSYLSGIFGQLGSEMMDSLSQNSDNMTAWADDVTGYISDSFSKMVKDIIYNMDFAADLAAEQTKIKNILADTTTTDAQKEQAMQDELTAFRAQLIADGTQAATDWNAFNAAWIASGGTDLAGSTTTANNTTSAIKSMDQPTADILTAQFSAMRIHTANMDVNLSKINVNFSDLLLSLQGQAGILQIAFNDVAEIKRNTNRIPEVADTLAYLKTYGIKVL